MRIGTGLLAGALALAGCKDEQKAAVPAAQVSLDGVRMAVLQALAAQPGMPKTVQFRGVQTYPQAVARRVAVCGLVSAFADDANIFVPFVTIAAQVSPPDAPVPRYEFDSHIGTTTAEASRVYSALVASCWEGGGPHPGAPLALPPLPDAIQDPRAPADAPHPAPTATAQPGAKVTVRQSANVHSSPGGPSVRTVAQGVSLRVFAQASGGWYQVGDSAPFGWVHESMLNR